MYIHLLSFMYLNLSYQAEWRLYVHEDEDPQQQEQPQNIHPEPHLLSVEDARACSDPFSVSPQPDEPEYISRQFNEVFTDPQKCFSYCPDNRPIQMRRFKNTLQRAFEDQERTDIYFKNLESCYEYNSSNPDFTRIGSCYSYTLNVGNTKLQLMPPQTSDDYAYESNCKTINIDCCAEGSLKKALQAIARCSNLHMVIENFEAAAIQKAILLVNHGLPKELRFMNGNLFGNVDITGVLMEHVLRVVVDVDQLGTRILSVLCMCGIRKLDISYNRLVNESTAPIYLSENCESLRLSSNNYREVQGEKIHIVIMGDSARKKKKEVKCNSKSISFIPTQYLNAANLTLAFEDEEFINTILQKAQKVKNLKLTLQSIKTNLEFLKQPHLKRTLIQMELIVSKPYSGKRSEAKNILEYYEVMENLALDIHFIGDSGSPLSLEGLQQRLNTLSLHSNTLEREFPLDPDIATKLQAIDMQWEKDSITTYHIPEFLARFESISDCILENVITKGFWRKIEELKTVESLLIKRPIDKRIQSNEMAPLYQTMKRLTISLTPRALSRCKFALHNLEEFNLSIMSGEDYIEKNEIKELFEEFCINHFTTPKNLIRLNLNQNCDFSMIKICEHPFPKLQMLNIERCFSTNTGEEMVVAEKYFERLEMWQTNRQIHANITFASSRTYSNKKRS